MRNGILTVIVWLATTTILPAQSGPVQTAEIGARARGASKIVVATVVDVTGRFGTNAHGDQLIYSDVVLEVSETLKGAAAPTVTMTIEGGEVGELKLEVSHMPTVRRGDRGLYFLGRLPRGEWVPYGGERGVLKILSADRLQNTALTLPQARALVRDALK